MAPKSKQSTRQNRAAEGAQRIDSPVEETVITLATTADRQRLRNELLRLIIKSESRRRLSRGAEAFQETVTTEGSAKSPIEAADA